jgi:YVTN family beta-propeller protein
MKLTSSISIVLLGASLPLGLNHLNLPLAASDRLPIPEPEMAIDGRDIRSVELGVWEGVVDLTNGQTTFKQLSGENSILVASILGNGTQVTTSGLASVNNNTTLVTKGTRKYASLSLRFRIANNTNATMGKTATGGTTGMRLQLVPYAGTTSGCEVGPTTLQQPICVVTNTGVGGKIGASGRNNGTDPVYLAYVSPRDGSNLASTDDPTAPELNEATGRINPTDFARTVWLPETTIAGGGSTTVGLRLRYQQDTPGTGSNQPRVTLFRYKFRLLADRTSGSLVPSSIKAYTTTVAGNGNFSFKDGVAGAAEFAVPRGLAIDPSGTKLYVADMGNNRIRQVNLATGEVITIAGSTVGFSDGVGTAAKFDSPRGVAISPDGNTLYIADSDNNRVRAIDLATKQVTTIAGNGTPGSSDGVGTAAKFNFPVGLVVSPNNAVLYVVDNRNDRIRAIDLATKEVTTVAGSTRGFNDGVGTAAKFNLPRGIAINPSGTILYVADQYNHRIRAINLATKQTSTVAGNSTPGFKDDVGIAAQFNFPRDVAIDPAGTKLYVADRVNHRIRLINIATKGVSTIGGDGTANFLDGIRTSTQFDNPEAVAVNSGGTIVYVADTSNHRLRQIQSIEGTPP